MSKRNRYRDFEQLMTVCLITNAALFVLYLIIAAAGVVWLKVVLAILTIVVAIGGLAFLYLSHELLRQRSLWMSTGFLSVLLCTVVSLILAFP